MLYAPITRLYTESYSMDADVDQVLPYVRNKNTYPKGMAACLGYLHKEWRPMWQGDTFCYEYDGESYTPQCSFPQNDQR